MPSSAPPAKSTISRRPGRWLADDPWVNRLLALAVAALCLAAWEIAAQTGYIRTLFFSSPSAVARTGWSMMRSGELWTNARASGVLFLAGFSLSVAIALPLGILLGWYRRPGAIADPFVTILYVTPRIAVLPLIFVWFGVGFSAQLVVVVMMAFFPLLINTMAGVRSLDPQLLKVARGFMASDFAIFRTIALPASIPHIFSGLRHAVSMALTGVVVAEFFMGNVGLGSLMYKAGSNLNADRVFVGVAAIAAFALACTFTMDGIDKRLSRWRHSNG